MSGPQGPSADSAVINAVAYLLAESTEWNGDELGVIADLIGTVRPHPRRGRTRHQPRTPRPTAGRLPAAVARPHPHHHEGVPP